MKHNHSQLFDKALAQLLGYVEAEDFKGYDPYDTLNTSLPIHKLGKWGSAIAIQIQKRNPVNLRPMLGIKKEHNPKALGLFLKTYSLLFKHTGNEQYLDTANKLFDLILDNKSKGFSGSAWGYNFDWANPGNVVKAYTPSVVVTAFVCDGLWEYYGISKSDKAKDEILSACDYIINDLPITKLSEGISIAYTHTSTGCCYNASLLGAETLSKAYSITRDQEYLNLIKGSVDFVLSKQKNDGSWYYSYNPVTGEERKQIDFHQGFVLISLESIRKLTGYRNEEVKEAVQKGLEFYYQHQFFDDGRSKWRLPNEYPVEIHNQAQGIITFSELGREYDYHEYFADTIAEWTIKNMQGDKGYFYYQMHRYYTNKIPYMRWSQAWMALALTLLKVDGGRKS